MTSESRISVQAEFSSLANPRSSCANSYKKLIYLVGSIAERVGGGFNDNLALSVQLSSRTGRSCALG